MGKVVSGQQIGVILQCELKFLPLQLMTLLMTTNSNPAASVPASGASSVTGAAAASAALGWLHTAKFLTTAPQLHFLPTLEVPEIAFVGRSNAGKSTCINTLTQQHRLAYASKTPEIGRAHV